MLHASGHGGIDTAQQGAQALKPLAGPFAFVLFALGMIGTGLLAIPVLTASAAYATSVGVAATPSFLIGTRTGALRQFQPSTLTPGPFTAALGALLKKVR